MAQVWDSEAGAAAHTFVGMLADRHQTLGEQGLTLAHALNTHADNVAQLRNTVPTPQVYDDTTRRLQAAEQANQATNGMYTAVVGDYHRQLAALDTKTTTGHGTYTARSATLTTQLAPQEPVSSPDDVIVGDPSRRHGVELVDHNWAPFPLDPTPQPPVPNPPVPSDPRLNPTTTPPAPEPQGSANPFPTFGQCFSEDYKKHIGWDMVKDGFKSGGVGAVMGGTIGAGLTPELAGAGAIPGGVLGFVGGFTKGLVEAGLGLGSVWNCRSWLPSWMAGPDPNGN